MRKIFTLLALSLLPNLSPAAVWDTTNSWSPREEQAYSDWVKTSWKVDVFRNPESPYRTGLNPDCADSVYSMRIIYAYEHGLPFAMLDPTTGRTILSNETKKFDSIPAGYARVRAFQNWIWDMAGTVTLPYDSYPIALSRENFQPGAFILAKESKHSYTLKKLHENGTPTLYYSTQGNDGNLKIRSWPSEGFLFSEGIKEPSGLRFFRYPEHLLLAAWEVPGYSNEQYQIPAGNWIRNVQNRLALRQETVKESLVRHMSDVCQLAITRVELVNKALDFNRRIGDRCLTFQEFDDLSTPSRDRQTISAFNELETVYRAAIRKNAKVPQELAEQLRNIFAGSLREESGSQYCMINYRSSRAEFAFDESEEEERGGFLKGIFGNKKKKKKAAVEAQSRGTMSLGELRRRFDRGVISSNPNDTGAVRWGDARGPSEKAARCPIY